MNEILVLGSGLCADGVVRAAKQSGVSFKVSDRKRRGKFTTIPSRLRDDPIVAHDGYGGMGKYYHGVFPEVLFDHPSFRDFYKIDVPEFLADPWSYYFVPRLVPRPQIARSMVTKLCESFKPDECVETFFCQSVVGNLSSIWESLGCSKVAVSDDVVTCIGEISGDEFSQKYPFSVKRSAGLAIFPAVLQDNCMVTFRPVFNEPANLNFIDVKSSLLEINPKNFLEKVRLGSFLRYGIVLGKIKKFQVFAQINITDCYEMTSTSFTESEILGHKLVKEREKLWSELARRFTSFIPQSHFYSSGIHLGYDRRILSSLPPNWSVLDTSLNRYPGMHPSLFSQLESFRIASELFSAK